GLVSESRRERVELGRGLGDAGPACQERDKRLAGPPLRLLRQVGGGSDALDAAGARRLDAREDAQERRLAAAVRADDPATGARRARQRERVEDGRGAELLGDVRCDERCAAHFVNLLIEKRPRQGGEERLWRSEVQHGMARRPAAILAAALSAIVARRWPSPRKRHRSRAATSAGRRTASRRRA